MKEKTEYEPPHYITDMLLKEWMDINWEHLPDYMKKPKWFNRELKIDEILKEDDV